MLLLSVLLLLPQVKGENLVCGQRPAFQERDPHSRIIGGTEAEVGEFPWQVSIQGRSQHFCGGTIISAWWILTAAHCVTAEQVILEELTVVMGTNDLTSPAIEVKAITSIVYHKMYGKTTMDNDIALLLLASPIKFNDFKVPICMPPQPSPAKWHTCWVAGWGQTDSVNTESMKTDLMKVPMVIMDWEECSKQFSKLTKNMLCAGHMDKDYDACQGDSGGGLVCNTKSDKTWYQVGIISWGRSCGQKNTPGIYTSLANYRLWIENVSQLEGRYHDTKLHNEKPRGDTKLHNEKPRGSQAAVCPVPGSFRLWVLPCLLSCVLLRAILRW